VHACCDCGVGVASRRCDGPGCDGLRLCYPCFAARHPRASSHWLTFARLPVQRYGAAPPERGAAAAAGDPAARLRIDVTVRGHAAAAAAAAAASAAAPRGADAAAAAFPALQLTLS
jgi:hypothetical protein